MFYMAVSLPHIEDANSTVYLPPKGDFEVFNDESHYAEKVKEWGLSAAKEVKKEFWYKEATHQRLVTIKGYEIYGKTAEFNTIVIEFQDGNLTCIHPAYLKEMQSSSFGKTSVADIGEPSSAPVTQKIESPSIKETKTEQSQKATSKKKEKTPKLELPTEKVHFTATVKQFALSWNNFNEENDEVVVLEKVIMEAEDAIEVGLAWCSHSKTLKKFELISGDTLEFDGKIVKKKLPKGKDAEEEFIVEEPVPYKINNPSKIKKVV